MRIRRTPFSPIFRRKLKYGSFSIGLEPGTTPVSATVSPGVVTLPVQVFTPTVTTTTTNCDDFDRASDSNLGSNWNETLSSGLKIASNQLTAGITTTAQVAMFTIALPSDDQYVECDAISAGVGGGVHLRFRFPSSNASYVVDGTGYEAFWDRSSGGTITLRRLNSGSPTTLATVTSQGNPAGERFRAEVAGSTIRVLVDGVEKINHTDGSPVSSGAYTGVRLDSPDADIIDNFCCGTL